MKIAVTGGTGFVGSSLVSRLIDDGHSVRLLIRKTNTTIVGNRNLELFLGALDSSKTTLSAFLNGVDVVYHCAAEISDPSKMASTNVEGTYRLARIAAGNVKHWVQLSTVDVFGSKTDEIVSESSPRGRLNLYEESKVVAEEAVVECSKLGNYTYSILRPSKIYGLRMRNRLIYKLINIVDCGLFFYIGRPGASANYIHVENVIDALILCGTRPEAIGQEYNLSDYCSVEELVGTIAGSLGKSAPTWRMPEKFARLIAHATRFLPRNLLTPDRVNAMVKRARYSSIKIESELGFKHGVLMAEGITQLVEKWKADRDDAHE